MLKFEYLIILLLSIVPLFLFNRIKDKIGIFFHVLDIPIKSKIHKKITPLIGAFPIFIFSFFLLIYFDNIIEDLSVYYLFICSYFFFITGYFDDRYNLNPYFKLGISIVIILITMNFVELFLINKIFIESINRIIILNSIELFFSILCVLLLINALNLMDGINGLASCFASGWLLSLSLISNNEKIFPIFLILSLFMIINTINIIKGKYFLGDSGTLFLGCLIGLFTIYTYNKQLALGNMIPIEKVFIFFMIPGIDMFRLFITRLLQRKNPFLGDLNHLHHIMIRKLSLKKTLLVYLTIFLITNLLAYYDLVNSLLIIIIFLTIYIFFIFFSKKELKETS